MDASVIKTPTVDLAGGTLTLDGYTGHTYGLQRSDSLTITNYHNVGAAQTGTTDRTLTFTDPAAGGGAGLTASPPVPSANPARPR